MKKLILGLAALALIPSLALARGYNHRNYHRIPQTPPVAQNSPISSPTSTVVGVPVSTPPMPQIGAYTGNNQASFDSFANKLGSRPQWDMVFWNPVDGFPTNFNGNLVIFLEPSGDDDVIITGVLDNQLKTFAQGASKYNGQVILAINEEVNCDNTSPWGGTYPLNNTQKAISAFQHIVNIIRPISPAIKFAYDVNNGSCFSNSASNSLTAYYPGNSFVDIVGVDGFDFGGQTWNQVFDKALTTLVQFHKPLWILSEGSVDNRSQFIKDTFSGIQKYGISGFLYFNSTDGGNWVLDSNALTTLKSFTS